MYAYNRLTDNDIHLGPAQSDLGDRFTGDRAGTNPAGVRHDAGHPVNRLGGFIAPQSFVSGFFLPGPLRRSRSQQRSGFGSRSRRLRGVK